jgi:UDP-4-amino-4,6-dideoxy-N-acetyl-beta-L-altrosamine N-acetyltransferase
MGESAPHLESVKDQVDALSYNSEVKVDVNNMAEIMANMDVAIGAVGATTWERCCLGLPTIQIVIAKNQAFSAETLASYNAIKLLKEVKEVASLLENPTEWMKDIGSIATQICDGMGVYKVFNKMTNYKIILEDFGEVELCNYVNLNADNKTLVLNMRNHPEIRKWMYNQDDILEDAHLRFIQSLENDIDRRYFLVKKHSNIIGSINFSQIDLHDSVKFGLYANPFESLKGLGAILEAVVTHYAFRELGVTKLKLEVLSNNERAINFYRKYGFKLIDIRKVNNKDTLYMEKRKTLEEV